MPLTRPVSRKRSRLISAGALTALFLAGPLANSAQAVVEVPPLLTAGNFSVLAGQAVTNTGISTIAQDLGVSPGTSLPPTAGADRLIVGGAPHSADAVALQAQNDLTAAYNNARGQTPPIAQDAELGGETKLGGIYKTPVTQDMGLTGALTLDGANNPNSIWVFQAGRDLNIASSASMVLIRGANPCRVFWQVDRTATLGTSSTMIGTIMTNISVVMQTGATLQGRILARTAEITMDTNVITNPACVPVGLETPTATPSPTPTPGTGGTGTGGNGGTGGTGGTNGGTGSTTDTDTQVDQTPTGSVDTGKAGPVASSDSSHYAVLTGWTLAAGFGVLALVAVRRRRRV